LLISDLLGAILVVVVFAWLIYVFGLVQTAKRALAIGRCAAQTLANNELSDAEKEKIMQSSSLSLFGLLGMLLLSTSGALLIPIGFIWFAQMASLVTLDGVIGWLSRWDFVAGASVVGIIIYVALVRWSKKHS
jgi:hypothetical protein